MEELIDVASHVEVDEVGWTTMMGGRTPRRGSRWVAESDCGSPTSSKPRWLAWRGPTARDSAEVSRDLDLTESAVRAGWNGPRCRAAALQWSPGRQPP